MTIAHSAASETTGAGSTVTHTHTPGAGTVSGITVMIDHGTTFSDIITGVTYGGVAMSREPAGDAFDDGGEIGRVYIYSLEASIPAGAQSVVVSKSNATTTIHVVCASVVTTSGVAEVVDVAANGGDDANEANPSITLNYGGRSCMGYVIEYNGVNAPGNMTEFAGQTLLHDHDFGNFSSKCSRRTNVETANPTMGYTVAINAFAMAGIAWAEVANDRRAIVTFAELEVPNAPRRAIVTFAEFEVPSSPRRAIITFAELEVPNGARRGIITFAELETPNAARRAIITWAEFALETDNNRRAEVTFAELEIPDAPRRGIITFAEFEVPNAARRGIITFAELEVPDGQRRAIITFAEFVVPDLGAIQETPGTRRNRRRGRL